MSEAVQVPPKLSDAEYQKMSPHEKENYVKEMLRNILKMNSHGLTISQLTRALPFQKRVMEKHLEVMKYTNEVYTVQLGSNIVYIPNHKAMHEATSHSIQFGDHEYQVYTLHNRFGDSAIIQQRRVTRDSEEIVGSLQLPLQDYDKFVAYLRKTITDMEQRGLK